MSSERDVTRIVRSWLDDGVTRLGPQYDVRKAAVSAPRNRHCSWPSCQPARSMPPLSPRVAK